LEDAQLPEEIEIALETTLAHPLTGLDHLCCGNFGRLDFLIEAASRLERPALLEAARARAATLLRRPGGFTLSGPRPLHLTGPGFFQGLSGIGYELLRLVEPGELKSVLRWA
jgi:lantibiotic modifying enzyme